MLARGFVEGAEDWKLSTDAVRFPIGVHCMFLQAPLPYSSLRPTGWLLFENGGAVLLCPWAEWPSPMFRPPLAFVQHLMAGHHIGT